MPTGFDVDRSGTVGGGNDAQGGYLYDDRGRRGGLGASERFVIAGDNNSDPLDGDSHRPAAARAARHRDAPGQPGRGARGAGPGRRPLSRLTDASDHHLVRVDVVVR
ncbi:hypothetical protein [Amycolatopsis sp. NPDC003731]